MESIITLTSIDASSTSQGNRWVFPLSVSGISRNSVFEVELLKIAFSHTQYPINTHNNVFYFQEETSAAVLTATIPEGYYTGDTLRTALTTAMDGPAFGTVTVTYNSTTKKFTFAGTDKLRFLDTSAYSTSGRYAPKTTSNAWRVLGLDVDTDSSLFSTLKLSHIGSVPADFSGSLYVKITFPGKIHGPVSSIAAGSLSTATLVVLPAFGEIVDYEPYRSAVHLINGDALGNLEMEFFDDTNQAYAIPFDLCMQLSIIQK